MTAITFSVVPISIVIPTYRREAVLVQTLRLLLEMDPPAAELIIVDQTKHHEEETDAALQAMAAEGAIRWLRLPAPSVTHAMNVGLEEARQPIVLFLDDDVIPGRDLLTAHARAHSEDSAKIVAGQVLQPGEQPETFTKTNRVRFNSTQKRWIGEFIGCNFSVEREFALALGGFDENFVHVAYQYEAEFSDRARNAGESVLFQPEASIRHIRASSGGTRSFGHHLTTIKPSHAVGAYYYLLRARSVRYRHLRVLGRFARSIRTKHHLAHPWWIPGTLVSEFLGLCWAIRLVLNGPRLIRTASPTQPLHDH